MFMELCWVFVEDNCISKYVPYLFYYNVSSRWVRNLICMHKPITVESSSYFQCSSNRFCSSLNFVEKVRHFTSFQLMVFILKFRTQNEVQGKKMIPTFFLKRRQIEDLQMGRSSFFLGETIVSLYWRGIANSNSKWICKTTSIKSRTEIQAFWVTISDIILYFRSRPDLGSKSKYRTQNRHNWPCWNNWTRYWTSGV